MIALGGPTLKLVGFLRLPKNPDVSMIALGGPTLKPATRRTTTCRRSSLNDSTGRAYTETNLTWCSCQPCGSLNDSTGRA